MEAAISKPSINRKEKVGRPAYNYNNLRNLFIMGAICNPISENTYYCVCVCASVYERMNGQIEGRCQNHYSGGANQNSYAHY